MTKEGVYEVGDTITVTTIDGGFTLEAVMADTDGSGCYVCDDGKRKCFFRDNEIPCPKCHSNDYAIFDYSGPRVIFIKQ